MRAKNNKGFTLIEIIGAVIILGILAIIAIPYFTKKMETFREDYYANIEKNAKTSGREFFTDNKIFLPNKYLQSAKVTINTLEKQKYIEEILDYEGNTCNKDSYVIVIKRGKDNYEYNLCLKCEEDDFDNTEKGTCDSAWETNDTLTVELGKPPVIYVYKGTTREELKDKLKIPADIVKYDNGGNELDRVTGEGEEGIPEILPNNIDTIDTNKQGEYETIYEYEGKTSTGKVIIYENTNPYISIQKINKVKAGTVISAEKEEKGIYNQNGEWVQKIVVTLGEGEEGETNYEEAGTKVSRYQWKRGERWLDFCIPTAGNACTQEVTTEMNETVYFRALDSEGNISRESGAYVIMIDNTKPLCELSLTGTEGDNAWYKSDVKIGFGKAIDQKGSNVNAVSGVNTKGVTLSAIGTALTMTQTMDTDSVTWYGFIEDKAKNSNVCSITFKKDATVPACTLKLDGTMGNNSWYTSNVEISFNSNTDNLSGVAEYGIGSVTDLKTKTQTTDTSGITYTGHIKDKAGNTNTCTINFKRDATKPTCTSSGGSTAWTNGTRTLTGTCADNLSECVGNITKPYSSNTNSTTESPGTVYDKAGNSGLCPANQTVKVDKNNPTCSLSVTEGTEGNNGWYKSETVKVGASFGDTGGSGVNQKGTSTSQTYDGTTSYTVSTNTTGITVNCYVKDVAGNTGSNSITIKKDDGNTGGCTISGTSTSWAQTRVIVLKFNTPPVSGCYGSSAMGGSMDGNCQGTYDATRFGTLSNEGKNWSYTHSATTKSGASVSCTASSVNVYIDNEKPTISCEKVNTGSKSGVTVKCTCSDSGRSGVKTCAGQAGTSATITGVKLTTTYEVEDNVGNKSSETVQVLSQVQERTASCSSCKRCEAAGCQKRQSCENSVCGTYQSCGSWLTSSTPSGKCGCKGAPSNCSSAISDSNTQKCATVSGCPDDSFFQERKCTIKNDSCVNDSCDCDTWNQSCSSCGCSSWNDPGSWTNKSSCTESTGTQTKTECQTIYN